MTSELYSTCRGKPLNIFDLGIAKIRAKMQAKAWDLTLKVVAHWKFR